MIDKPTFKVDCGFLSIPKTEKIICLLSVLSKYAERSKVGQRNFLVI